MQPTLCSRCKKNVAVIFITRIENGESHNEGLCLRCARELHIKPVDEMMEKLGISDADLDNLTGEVRPATRRPDLTPVFSFNSAGLWVAGANTSTADPTTRLSRWRDVLARMQREGLTLTQ